jgi:hypothetical protein
MAVHAESIPHRLQKGRRPGPVWLDPEPRDVSGRYRVPYTPFLYVLASLRPLLQGARRRQPIEVQAR